jgi:LuxR family maltose regulon positive regulatory protein
MTNKEIAAELTISVGTVKGHTVHIYEKLGVKGRQPAVEKAIELGILASQ